jgi:hypothetical protein
MKATMSRNAVLRAVVGVLEDGFKEVVVFDTTDRNAMPKVRVKATRIRKHGNIMLTIGRPNYRESRICKQLLKAGLKVPVRLQR